MQLLRTENSRFTGLTIPIVLSGLLVFLLVGIYVYGNFFHERNQFPIIKSTVDTATLESSGYRRIEVENNEYAYFVPVRWTNIDNEVTAYGDLLTGANAYMQRYPNSLGKLTQEICESMAKDSAEVLARRQPYTNLVLLESSITKVGDFESCLAQYKTTIAAVEFQVSQVFIFRKENIYTLFVQYPANQALLKENIEVILDSISIKE